MSLPCLFTACNVGDLTVVVQHASLNFPGPKVANNEASALYIACCQGHTDIVRILMESQQFDPNQKNYRGYSPLYAACRKHHMDIFHMLLVDPRTDVNTIWVEEEDTMYHCSDEVIMLLSQHKSFNINRPFWMEQKVRRRFESDKQKIRRIKTTFLQHAIYNRDLTMFKTIMKHPLLNPNICDPLGAKPVIVMAAEEETKYEDEMFRALVRHPKTRPNARPNARNQKYLRRTIFHQMIVQSSRIFNNRHTIQTYQLLSHWPEIKLNIPDAIGKTPLDFCDEKWNSISKQETVLDFFTNISALVDELDSKLGTSSRSYERRQDASPRLWQQFYNMRCRETRTDWSKSTENKMVRYLTYIAKRLFHSFAVVQEDPTYWDNKIKDAFKPRRANYKLGRMLYTYEIVRQKKLPHEMFKEIFKWFWF